MKNIFISGASINGNKGAEAMLLTVLNWLDNRQVPCRLIIENSSPNSNLSGIIKEKYKKFDIVYIGFKLTNVMDYISNVRKYNVDVILDIGGLNFQDKSKKGTLRTFVKYLPLLVMNKKLIFFIQDLGPANNWVSKTFGGYLLKKSEGVFVRSDHSYNVATNKLSALKSKVFGPFPDMTFKMKVEKNPGNANLIIIVPSFVMYNLDGEGYITKMKELVQLLTARGYEVLGVAHSFSSDVNRSDQYVVDKIGFANTFSNIELDAMELKKLLGTSQLVITSRYHALIGALSCSVPSIAVGWNPKYQEALKIFGLEDLNIPEFDNEVIMSKVEYIFSNSLKIKETLSSANSDIQKKLDVAFSKLDAIL